MEFVTDAEIEGYLNIEGLPTKYTTAGQDANALAVVKRNANALVKAHLQEKHRRMMRVITGYKLTTNAAEGATVFNLPEIAYDPDADQSYIWVNPCGFYGDRSTDDAVEYTLAGNAEDGYTVTLAEALSAGDKVIMDIVHSGINAPSLLKKCALDCAVNELITRKPSLCNDPIMRDTYARNYADAQGLLSKILLGKLRIDEWDDLSARLVLEHQTVSPEGPGTLIVGW